MTPSASTTPPFMSTVPDPTRLSPSRSSGRWAACDTTVSTWPSRRMRPAPLPANRATMSCAWSGDEHGTRSRAASSGTSAAHTAAHSSAPWRSPDGDDTATSASSSRSARRAISCEHLATHSSMARHAIRLPSTGDARAARDGDRRTPPGRGARGRDDRVGGGAGHQRAQDVRPPAERARRDDDRGRAAAGQAADARRGRAHAADAPHERGAPPALRQARLDARPHGAGRPPLARRPRAAAARVRHASARVGQAPAPGGARRGGVARPPRPGGLAGPAGPPGAPARAAAAAHAPARPVRRRGDRPHLGRRDPPRGDAVAVQARRRPLRRGGRPPARGDGRRARPRARRLRGAGGDAAAREVPQADAGAQSPGRAVPALRGRARGRLLRGLRHDLLPALPDGGTRAQGSPALEAAQVIAEGERAPDFTLPDQDGRPVTLSELQDRRVVLYFYPKADTPVVLTAMSRRTRHGDQDRDRASLDA